MLGSLLCSLLSSHGFHWGFETASRSPWRWGMAGPSFFIFFRLIKGYQRNLGSNLRSYGQIELRGYTSHNHTSTYKKRRGEKSSDKMRWGEVSSAKFYRWNRFYSLTTRQLPPPSWGHYCKNCRVNMDGLMLNVNCLCILHTVYTYAMMSREPMHPASVLAEGWRPMIPHASAS